MKPTKRIATTVLIIILSSIFSGCADEPWHETIVTKNTIGAAKIEDFALAITAGRHDDVEAMLALVATGRAYEVTAGTRISWKRGTDEGVAIAMVESGPLIGKVLFMDATALSN